MNDSLDALDAESLQLSYALGDGEIVPWGTLRIPEVQAQSNRLCGAISIPLPEDFAGKIHVYLTVKDHPEMNSEYTYLCRTKQTQSTAGLLNV